MRVARVEEDVGHGHVERLGDRDSHRLGRPLPPQREVDAHDREVDPDHDDLRRPVGEDERRRRQVALDRLHRVAEEPEARLSRAERRIDDPARGAGLQRPRHVGVISTPWR